MRAHPGLLACATALAVALLPLSDAADEVVAQAGTKRAQSRDAAAGKATFEAACGLCHATGVAGAPRLGSAPDWKPRLARGVPALYQSALQGTAKGMPPKGGRLDLPDAEVKAAVDYMVAQVQPVKPPAGEAAKPAAPAEPSKPSAAQEAAKPPAAEPQRAAAPHVSVAEANAFNRLLKPAGKRNLPPAEDGIHDPGSDGTHALQPPMQAFEAMPRSPAGNRVNWVQALTERKISPRWDRADDQTEPTVMDLNIVRKVKGSMPDVVYPHKQHTEWLDCSNCHPALFTPQAGANQISMAAILLGQKCGVCHGKVAFPVSECRLCHSRKKDPQATAAAEGAKP